MSGAFASHNEEEEERSEDLEGTLRDSQMAVPVRICLDVRVLVVCGVSSSFKASSTTHAVSCRIVFLPQHSCELIAAEIISSRNLCSLDVVSSDVAVVVVSVVVESMVLVVLFATASAQELGPPIMGFWLDLEVSKVGMVVIGFPLLHAPVGPMFEAHELCCCGGCCCKLKLLLLLPVKLGLVGLRLLLLFKMLLELLVAKLLLLVKLLFKLLLLVKLDAKPEVGLEFNNAGLVEAVSMLLLAWLLGKSC